jgi:tetratricopeptide (TPR) repeat protein
LGAGNENEANPPRSKDHEEDMMIPSASRTLRLRSCSSSVRTVHHSVGGGRCNNFSSSGVAVGFLRPRSSSVYDRRNNAGGVVCHHRLLSSTAVSSDGRPPLVEVTVTSTSSSSNNNNDSNNNNNEEHPSSRLPKTSARETEEVMLSLNEEIRLHFRHASYEDALTVASKLLTMTTEHFGTLHPATASAYNNVGLMNKSLGRYNDAKEAYHESLRIYGEVCGKDHASYAAALSNLGMLERGRAMESEGSSSESNDVDESSGNESTKTETEKKMSAMERMRLNDSAIEYLDESYRIRLAELGPDHPHTVSSRSQLGAAMAASVITERRGMISGLVEVELRKLKHIKNVRNSSDMETYVPEAIAKAASGVEEHLRGALDTAVRNPRGESVQPLMYISLGSSSGNDDAGGSGNNASSKSTGNKGLTLPSRRESKEGMSKKEKKKLGKEKIRDKRRANAMALHAGVGNESSDDADDDESDNHDSVVDGGGKDKLLMSVQGVAAKVSTLSAATSAQNLAVFLKNYSDWTRLSLLDEKGDTTQRREGLNQTVQEARHLYESALHVRSSILPPHHPDVIATKFSLAELLDSPLAMARTGTTVEPAGLDNARANQLREEILNAYNVEEREEDKDLSA